MDRSRASRGPETADRWAGRAAGNRAAGSPSSACGRAAAHCCTDPRCPAEVAWLCRCWCRRDDPVQREKEKERKQHSRFIVTDFFGAFVPHLEASCSVFQDKFIFISEYMPLSIRCGLGLHLMVTKI